ncbi:MAG: alpha-glucuronidase [Muribaculaceae bacterium]|nr:alpha-glucuronidase [Muribaculaceae bacterium]
MRQLVSIILFFLAGATFATVAAAKSHPASGLSDTRQIATEELKQHFGKGKVTVVISQEAAVEPEGFIVKKSGDGWLLVASTPNGALYGAYDMIRRDNMSDLPSLYHDAPNASLRLLNHWDNLDGTIERGYAGKSIWKWDGKLTEADKELYRKYARINASVGINGTVLNNVNASPQILSESKLKRVAEIADILRPYGQKVYLSVNFASPMALDSLASADPLLPEVQQWWQKKADEIYALIPDFGGFLVKANSEGQPGPMDFGRTHADGANMLARALAPYNGIVMWRAFVYSPTDDDRAKQAYLEFQPLDGKFLDNVIVQIKNGPIDFQPREPHSPLFGAMPSTSQMAELQITQEYLGHSNHLAFLAPMWSEFFDCVPHVGLKGVAGVANVGDCENLTGHPLAMANWYAFGRMAWDPDLTPQQIAEEWLKSGFLSPDTSNSVVDALVEMMTESREAVVDYMMPLGLHHIFAFGHHYGPQPWCDVPGAREDWLPRYYHRADAKGLGFDRTATGSDAVSQYSEPFRSIYADLDQCPEELLLWFHHVPWDYKMKSGLTLWEELCAHYQKGVEKVKQFQKTWASAKPYVDPAVFDDVALRLDTQKKDAEWWRDACLSYFGEFSGIPLPSGYPAPKYPLSRYKSITLPITNYECPSPALLDSVR